VSAMRPQTSTAQNCCDEPFKSTNGIARVLGKVQCEIAAFLKDHLALGTGDYYFFINIMDLRKRHPAKFGNIVPIPGPFHLALNAQQAVIGLLRDVVHPLWVRAFGPPGIEENLSPMERKYVLDVLCRVWDKWGPECRKMMSDCRRVPVELVALQKILDEWVPLCTDIYTVFMTKDLDSFLSVPCSSSFRLVRSTMWASAAI